MGKRTVEPSPVCISFYKKLVPKKQKEKTLSLKKIFHVFLLLQNKRNAKVNNVDQRRNIRRFIYRRNYIKGLKMKNYIRFANSDKIIQIFTKSLLQIFFLNPIKS